jgi:hypothetical protein
MNWIYINTAERNWNLVLLKIYEAPCLRCFRGAFCLQVSDFRETQQYTVNRHVHNDSAAHTASSPFSMGLGGEGETQAGDCLETVSIYQKDALSPGLQMQWGHFYSSSLISLWGQCWPYIPPGLTLTKLANFVAAVQYADFTNRFVVRDPN